MLTQGGGTVYPSMCTSRYPLLPRGGPRARHSAGTHGRAQSQSFIALGPTPEQPVLASKRSSPIRLSYAVHIATIPFSWLTHLLSATPNPPKHRSQQPYPHEILQQQQASSSETGGRHSPVPTILGTAQAPPPTYAQGHPAVRLIYARGRGNEADGHLILPQYRERADAFSHDVMGGGAREE
jgi:hypothetical protein